ILSVANVGGALVGGASLAAESFLAIVGAAWADSGD
ncbi:MAG: triose-phosphate isomerase, partial [Novosphingobium sp.]|nr:triose-phosphate isomerase [Novosphingobium sp.]